MVREFDGCDLKFMIAVALKEISRGGVYEFTQMCVLDPIEELVSLGAIPEDGVWTKLCIPLHPAGREVPFISNGCCRWKRSRIRCCCRGNMV